MLFLIKTGDCKQKYNKMQNLEIIKIFTSSGATRLEIKIQISSD